MDQIYSRIATICFEVLSFFIFLIIIPFFLPLSFIFGQYRRYLHKLVKKETNGEARIVAANDSCWLQDSWRNRAIINSLSRLKGKPDVELFRREMTNRVINAKNDKGKPLFAKLTCYPTVLKRRFVWKQEKEFNINDHVILWEQVRDERPELESLVGKLCSAPFPHGKSQWQWILIPHIAKDGNAEDETFHLVIRLHHSIGDGISIMQFMLKHVMDGIDNSKELDIRGFGRQHILLRSIKTIFQGPAALLKRALLPGDSHALHCGKALSGEKLVAWSHPINLNLIKKIKNVTGTTVNDVLTSCLGGAIRDYFENYYMKLPSKMTAYMPVDIRRSKEIILDNEFSLVFLPIPLKEESQVKRLMKTKKKADEVKSSPEPLLNSLVIQYSMSRLPNWLTKLVFDIFTDKCSLILSNVPGPQHKLQLFGNVVETMVFWPPQRHKIGMGVSIFSYSNDVKVGVMTDKVLMTNPGALVDLFEENVYKLAKELDIDCREE